MIIIIIATTTTTVTTTNNNSSTNALNLYAAPKSLKLLRGLFVSVLLILTFMHTLFDRTDHNYYT